MDQEIINNFYVTLPSNSSFDYFPQNTQSSFRTKLSSPLILNGEWQVSLNEIFIPRNWYNINEHNNTYSVLYETEESVIKNYIEYPIHFVYETELDRIDICEILNNSIINELGNQHENIVKFFPHKSESIISVEIKEGFELKISPDKGGKLLYMLSLPDKDIVIRETTNFKYRPSQQAPLNISFIILNKNPKNVFNHNIPLHLIKREDERGASTFGEIINIIEQNLKLIELENIVNFQYNPMKNSLIISVKENAEIFLSQHSCATFLKKLNLKNDTYIRNTKTFHLDPLISVDSYESMQLLIYEYYETAVKKHSEKILS